eukprot:TRINITY_DN3472_c0_g2_i2.p1 TRINITY_DN3472_c0_g2~~TRINITY_DN3472_c0_g2_i2.p1  ORF type:complete len:268 (-),score=51.95 TRINITY_DN3472_c0_g2_i2:212-1015(-)
MDFLNSSAADEEQYTCKLCKNLFHFPMLIKTCEHSFCKSCIVDLNEMCICRNRFDPREDVVKDDNTFANMKKKTKQCNQCGATIPLYEYTSHFKNCDPVTTKKSANKSNRLSEVDEKYSARAISTNDDDEPTRKKKAIPFYSNPPQPAYDDEPTRKKKKSPPLSLQSSVVNSQSSTVENKIVEYACTMCNESGLQQDDMIQHVKEFHPNVTGICPICRCYEGGEDNITTVVSAHVDKRHKFLMQNFVKLKPEYKQTSCIEQYCLSIA